MTTVLSHSEIEPIISKTSTISWPYPPNRDSTYDTSRHDDANRDVRKSDDTGEDCSNSGNSDTTNDKDISSLFSSSSSFGNLRI